MTSLSAIAAILREQLSDAFAEVACRSSLLANQLLEQFPSYGKAKGDLSHAFWHRDAQGMLMAIQQLPEPICEEIEY